MNPILLLLPAIGQFYLISYWANYLIQSFSFIIIWLSRVEFFLFVFIFALIMLYLLKILLVKKDKAFFSFLYSLGKSLKKVFNENPQFQKFLIRHNKILKFFHNRFKSSSFFGLPLTLFTIIFLYVLMLFISLVQSIRSPDIILAADIRIANLITVFRDTKLIKLFLWITLLGKWQVILVFTIVIILILLIWKKRNFILPLLLSILGSEAFTYMAKIIFHRTRPSLPVYIETSFSFPSGHATIAFAFYGFLVYMLIRHSKQWSRKINAFFAGLIVILLIGFSRLYLGVHYLSDVWGGYLSGAIWLTIAIGFSEYLLYRKNNIKIVTNIKKKKFITLAIILVSIIFYIIFSINYQPPGLVQKESKSLILVNDSMSIFSTEEMKYTETLFGNTQEPLSFIILAKNDEQLVNLFSQAEWQLADKATISTTLKLANAALWKESYSKAPMTPDFWATNVHDFGFEKATDVNNVRTRHHARFWKTNYIMDNGYTLYVGTASFDEAIKWGITHKINPDIDSEREFLLQDLEKTGLLTYIEKKQSVKSKLGSNFSGDLFFTDGKLYVVYLAK